MSPNRKGAAKSISIRRDQWRGFAFLPICIFVSPMLASCHLSAFLRAVVVEVVVADILTSEL